MDDNGGIYTIKESKLGMRIYLFIGIIIGVILSSLTYATIKLLG